MARRAWSIFLFRPSRDQVLRNTEMIQNSGHDRINHLLNRFWMGVKEWICGNECGSREQEQFKILHMDRLNGASRGTRINFLRSFNITSAARNKTSSL